MIQLKLFWEELRRLRKGCKASQYVTCFVPPDSFDCQLATCIFVQKALDLGSDKLIPFCVRSLIFCSLDRLVLRNAVLIKFNLITDLNDFS